MSETNVFQLFTNVVAGLMINNIGTTQTQANTLNFYTDSEETLTDSWNNGLPDPNSQMGKDYAKLLEELKEAQAAEKSGNPLSGGKFAQDLHNFIHTYLVPGNLYNCSQALGVQLMGMLNDPAFWPSGKDKTQGTNDLNFLNGFNNLINTSAQNEEKPGQTAASTESSVIQGTQTAQQSLADVGTSLNNTGANIASLLQQSF